MPSIAEMFLSQESEAGELRDLLFRASTSPEAHAIAGPVSDRLALGYLRKSLPHATAVAANSSTSPEVLRKFVKDGRVAVRRALLTNPSTPPDALLDLMKWVCERGGAETSEVLVHAGRMGAEQIVELSRFIAEKRYVPLALSGANLRSIAVKVAADAKSFEQVEIRSFRYLGTVMASLALSGALPGRTLSEVVSRVCGDAGSEAASTRKSELVRDLIASGGVLTQELVELWGSETEDFRTRLGKIRPAALVEPGVLERFVADGRASWLAVALVNRAPERLFQGRIPEMDIRSLAAVAGTLGWGYLSPLSERLVASRLAELAEQPSSSPSRERIAAMAAAVVIQSESELPEDLLLGALRLGGMLSTSAWLAPRPIRVAMPDGEVLEMRSSQPVSARVLAGLVADPGHALDRTNAPYALRHRPEGWRGVMDELFEAAAISAEHGRSVAAALGDELGGYALHRGARSLYPYIRERLGADESRWKVFLEMAGTWQGSLDELIETTALLAGR